MLKDGLCQPLPRVAFSADLQPFSSMKVHFPIETFCKAESSVLIELVGFFYFAS